MLRSVRRRDEREFDRRRREDSATRALYGTPRWKRLRAAQFYDEPLCRICTAAGLVVAASVCDHVEPHRGDVARFWAGPFQSLCTPCHNGQKQRQEGGRVPQTLDDAGWPV